MYFTSSQILHEDCFAKKTNQAVLAGFRMIRGAFEQPANMNGQDKHVLKELATM